MAALAVAMGGWATEAVAQQSGTSSETPSAATAPVELGPISVTATRSPISAMRYPGMVTVIDRDQIELKDPDTIEDMFRSVPGVHFEGGPRRTGQVPTIRGFEGENVQIRIDGARQNFVSGHNGRVFVDPALLAGGEVLRGPASSLYGSGAMGGMIALRTLSADDLLEGDDTLAGRAKFGYQDVNQEFTESLVVGGRPMDGVGLLGGIVKRDSDDIELGNGTSLVSDDDIISGLAKADVDVMPGLSASLSYLVFNNDAREPANGQGANTAADSDITDKDIRSDTIRGQVLYAPLGQSWVDLDASAYFTKSQVEQVYEDSGRVTDQDVDTYGLFIDNRSRFSLAERSSLTLTYGVEASQDEQKGYDSASADGTRSGVPNAEAEFAGAFLQGSFEVRDVIPGTLTVIPGVRYDSFSADSEIDESTSDDEVSPKIAVSYEPIRGLVGFASYGRAFRAPSINELYNEGTHFAIPLPNGQTAVNSFVANPNLKPEVSDTLEFGLGYERADTLMKNDEFRIKGAYFQSEVENLIDISVNSAGPSVSCFIPPYTGCNAGTTDTVNVPEAELEGYELEASYDAQRFYLTAGFSSIDGENTRTGESLGVLTPDRLSTDIGLRLFEIDTVVGVEGEFASGFDKVDDPSEERGGYSVFDLYLQWAPSEQALRGLTINLGVDNVFDRDYERVFAGVSEPGRNYKGSIAYRLAF
ncbi:TonB-dependent hemoglobin/transferrin/lactoferrin family receptor [Thalassobaculum sp.]|uniref:TonB-dependent hemoglobin/transferrin/lactoferrin family receptor n=1 Tax=Thalassobaculum sp. TaxID=2022740 RepID=UPI003B5A1D5B